ncbi:MAG: ATP-binding cassette domain-containing protein, partial [Prolixibacteraceae bacterium]|nr:ATP-binding cassette domain-containing protein [Prolixibacteraceae bacterium]
MNASNSTKQKPNFIHFLKNEYDKPLLKIGILTAVSGLSSTGVLAIINMAAQNDTDTLQIGYLLMFISIVGIFITSQKFILVEGVAIIEEILNNLRLRLADKIRKTDLLNIEKIGNAKIYNRLTQESALISQIAVYLITAIQSGIMLIFIFAYIAYLNLIAALILVVLLTIGVLIFRKNNKKVIAELDETNKSELEYFNSLTDILEGLKEIKLNRKKSGDLFQNYGKISSIVHDHKVNTGKLFSLNTVFSQAFIYIVLGAIVFILPQLSDKFSEEIISTTTAMLFAIGPLSALVAIIPQYEQLNLSVRNIYDLEEELNMNLNQNEVQPLESENRFKDFNKSEFKDLYFEYEKLNNSDSFSVGPINFSITKGEIIFFIGGNGCGKTTLLKMLTMLYSNMQSGKVFVDDKIINDTNYLDYRELYSAIFYDFHLFEKLYGLEDIDSKKVNDLLKLMQIAHKTEFQKDKFTKQNLSTGQRKRLALIITFLENKPIYIFDEWAADQDP